ncbi:hypothetical protein PTTG_30940, partial [Puccinia triticina 1-1 BBBD Race 1]
RPGPRHPPSRTASPAGPARPLRLPPGRQTPLQRGQAARHQSSQARACPTRLPQRPRHPPHRPPPFHPAQPPCRRRTPPAPRALWTPRPAQPHLHRYTTLAAAQLLLQPEAL